MTIKSIHGPSALRRLGAWWSSQRSRRRRATNARIVQFDVVPQQDELFSLLYRIEDARGKAIVQDLIAAAGGVATTIRFSSVRTTEVKEFVEGLMPAASSTIEAYSVLEAHGVRGDRVDNALRSLVEIKNAMTEVGGRIERLEEEAGASFAAD